MRVSGLSVVVVMALLAGNAASAQTVVTAPKNK
jgi:hypothetical protein